MLDILLDPSNFPFTAALAAVALLTAVETLLLVVGVSLSHALHGVLPDMPDIDGGGLDWLGLGKAPIAVVLVCLATLFGVFGILIQAASASLGFGPLNTILASVLAVVALVPTARPTIGAVARLIPQDETYVGCRNKLVGSMGVIVQGTATASLPAQCKVPDGHGGSLYVQVVPEGVDALPEGSKVIIIRKQDHEYAAAPFKD